MTSPNASARTVNASKILLVMWVVWAVQLAALVGCYLYVASDRAETPAPQLINLIGVGPFFLSVIIRWLAMPRVKDPMRLVVLFLVGCAMGELCGFLGIFFGGAHEQIMFVLGLFAVGQFLPIFARRQLGLPSSAYQKFPRA
jgi:hypothetical protein